MSVSYLKNSICYYVLLARVLCCRVIILLCMVTGFALHLLPKLELTLSFTHVSLIWEEMINTFHQFWYFDLLSIQCSINQNTTFLIVYISTYHSSLSVFSSSFVCFQLFSFVFLFMQHSFLYYVMMYTFGLLYENGNGIHNVHLRDGCFYNLEEELL